MNRAIPLLLLSCLCSACGDIFSGSNLFKLDKEALALASPPTENILEGYYEYTNAIASYRLKIEQPQVTVALRCKDSQGRFHYAERSLSATSTATEFGGLFEVTIVFAEEFGDLSTAAPSNNGCLFSLPSEINGVLDGLELNLFDFAVFEKFANLEDA